MVSRGATGSAHLDATPSSEPRRKSRFGHVVGRVLTYVVLCFWAFICLFPIYWTFTTSLKDQVAVLQGPTYIPFVDFQPSAIGWTDILGTPDQRDILIRNARNSLVIALAASTLAVILGSMAGYGLTRFNYRFLIWRNRDISFWFLSQLILPPAAVVMPLLILYRQFNLLDKHLGLILLYTVINLPIVIWIMRDQFNSIPVDLEQAALVDGDSLLGAFLRVVVPVAGPGIVAAFILSVILSWNEYFFATVLTSINAVTMPILIATQVSSQGIKWWAMAAVATACIAPLVIIGVFLERFIVRGLTAGAVK
jgi:multiple sugar transport system permease protein